jgi:4-amino-4-deoxy-L-arabinose transferase-like glycosyltransferase
MLLARDRALLGVGLGAFVVRLAVVVLTPSYVPIHDDRSYAAHALVLLVTGHYPVVHLPGHVVQAASYRPPGWPAVLWVLWQITGPGTTAARVLLAVLGSLVAVLVLLIAQRLFGRRAGVVAGVLAALCPPLIAVGASLESETFFSVLVLGAVLAALASRAGGERARALVAAAGVLVGMAALTRTNGLALVPVVAILAAHGELRSARTWLTGAVALLAAVCVIAPWTLRNARDLHAFIPVSTETGNTLAGTYDATAARSGGRWIDPRPHGVYPAIFRADRSSPQLDAALTSASLRYAARHPIYPAEVVVRNTGRFMGLAGPDWIGFSLVTMSLRGDDAAAIVWLGLLLTVGLGLAGAVLARGQRVPRALWGVPVALWLSAALVNGELRLATPMLPFLCILGGLALVRLSEQHPIMRVRLPERSRS